MSSCVRLRAAIYCEQTPRNIEPQCNAALCDVVSRCAMLRRCAVCLVFRTSASFVAKLGAKQLQDHLWLHGIVAADDRRRNADGVRSHSCSAESENLAKY